MGSLDRSLLGHWSGESSRNAKWEQGRRCLARVAITLPLLLLVGCGDPPTILGIGLGDTAAHVLAERSGLTELIDLNENSDLLTEEAREAGQIRGYSRVADPEADPPEKIAREDYYFGDGKLILAVLVFAKSVQFEELQEQFRTANGAPGETLSFGGGSVHSWNAGGSQVRLMRTPGTTRLKLPGGSVEAPGGSSIAILAGAK